MGLRGALLLAAVVGVNDTGPGPIQEGLEGLGFGVG